MSSMTALYSLSDGRLNRQSKPWFSRTAETITVNAPGPATRLTVTVKMPATSHEVRLSKIEAWLESGGRSPNEQAMKVRLRELLGL
jgi:hypothetical protein